MNDLTVHEHATGPRGERVLVRRSARRRRTVSISRRDGDLVIAIPAAFSAREEREWVAKMVDQLVSKEARRSPTSRSDASLRRMAREVSEKHLGGRAHPTSVTWSTRQNQRWGSCTPSDGTIRLSHQLRGMPDYVVRAVMMHELVHLLVPDHGPDFQALMANYPLAEKARGFLDGVSWAKNLPEGAGGLEDDLQGDADGLEGDLPSGADGRDGATPGQPLRRAR
ncbi:M48 family metallopeptidase [Brachybacterium saurashtrense]|uniref:M48 family peptidase n=1 Tax=Brachybacterium saurashtrense TaxID=556288 RepID=A0A345YL93_9MICO|nr:M48 family metallopeptidase [Brachybacterium saurashtrense]AXK44695.1 M48 family peptidase [Brachybacterium saurashtrense]RRR23307.1 M48 family peptidase [Brachybacterium saurashtrense]